MGIAFLLFLPMVGGGPDSAPLLGFLSVALGTAMSGVLAKLYNTDHESTYFGVIGLVALVLGGMLALAAPPVRRPARDRPHRSRAAQCTPLIRRRTGPRGS
jgi:POT family proton-dependent oligopeptide transporter